MHLQINCDREETQIGTVSRLCKPFQAKHVKTVQESFCVNLATRVWCKSMVHVPTHIEA